MKTGAIIFGLVFLVVGVTYLLVPADALPGFFPGFDPRSTRIHVKHGIVALIASAVLFALAWVLGRRNRPVSFR
jgi:drug/metabolite transporter (DMT)-like permease